METQDQDVSCGAAAVATLVRYHYGQKIYEKGILDEIRRIGTAAERLRPYTKAVGDQLGVRKLNPAERGALEEIVQDAAGPASFQDLRAAARGVGFQAIDRDRSSEQWLEST